MSGKLWTIFILTILTFTYSAQLTYFLFRKIWSFICINTLPPFCSCILCSVWPCGWVSPLHLCFTLSICFFSSLSPFMTIFTFAASVGLSFLQFTNMNSMRNLFITGVALFLGFSIPEYFREYTSKALHGPAHTRAGWVSSLFHVTWSTVHVLLLEHIILISLFFFFFFQLNDFLNTIFFSSPTVALIVAVFLDNTLDYKDSGKDRGMPWWAKFRTFNGDSRNEEFYTLPFNLNRFFPPR